MKENKARCDMLRQLLTAQVCLAEYHKTNDLCFLPNEDRQVFMFDPIRRNLVHKSRAFFQI